MSNNGRIGEDVLYNNTTSNADIVASMAHFSPNPRQAATVSGPIPPPIMWQPPLLNQQYIHHHHPHSQQSLPQQQQQQYNELYYNVHAQAYAAPPVVQPETYSVLPVGHGNFLKVYHRPDSSATSTTAANEPILYQTQYPQQHQFHLATPQQPQPMFNSYELFSSNTLMATPNNANSNVSPNITAQELPLHPSTVHWTGNNTELHSTAGNTNSTTNMIINKLVNNWSPNLTGGTYSEFSSPIGAQMSNRFSTEIQNGAVDNSQIDPSSAPMHPPQLESATMGASPVHDGAIHVYTDLPPLAIQSTSLLSQQAKQEKMSESCMTSTDEQRQKGEICDVTSTVAPEVRLLKESPPASICLLQTAEGKKRIVAEVKPMRMTYSDVLSKLNNQHTNPAAAAHLAVAIKPSNDRKAKLVTIGSPAAATFLNDRKTEQKRSTEPTANFVARQTIVEETKCKKSPQHVNKENVTLQSNAGTGPKAVCKKQRSAHSIPTNMASNKQSQKATQKITTSDNGHSTVPNTNAANKKSFNKRTEIELNSDGSSSPHHPKRNDSNVSNDKDFNGFYNVTAKNTESKAKAPHSTPAIHSFRRSTRPTFTNATQHLRNAQRWNGTASSSAAYSTRRVRGSNAAAGNNATNRNYELAKKFFKTWFQYTTILLNWLFYLVYDIIVLGLGMVYEQFSYFYASSLGYAKQLRAELGQNSNRPSIWVKNNLRRFDSKFQKNSRWAFWRYFHKKKQAEISVDFHKNGRLPQTGEEAMYSLLNCKGKDAYSILGVPPNGSQEQIRKHYKKIAVLVHPDKNKQAGAEEAFKVLQRAFELIGEPENRETYDRSLDEALHAEKAWTELHDLLSQLQTKITEAANTIRCSTCGLRHPRKRTDRPHYAARECASCKIRHSAREGDIWAETTLMGLRWKYLALMEGKVYNITEWANCQKGALAHLEPNSHMVQYRIVRGAQQEKQQSQQQQSKTGTQQQFQHMHPEGTSKYNRDIPASEATLHEFLDNLYSGQHPGGQSNTPAFSGTARRRNRRN